MNNRLINCINFIKIPVRFFIKGDPFIWHRLFFYYCRFKFFKNTISSKKNDFKIYLENNKHLICRNLIPLNELNILKNLFELKKGNSRNKNIIIKRNEIKDKKNKKYVYLFDVFEKYTHQVEFLYLDDECIHHMMNIYIKYLKEIVENYFLCPSTIENMWVYKSNSESLESKNNYNYSWHYDGNPDKTLKIIFYINDVNNENGPLSIMKNSYANSNYDNKIKESLKNYDGFMKKFDISEQFQITGKSGTTIFFNSALLFHCAGEIKKGNRLVGSFLVRANKYKNVDYSNKPINVLYSKNPFLI